MQPYFVNNKTVVVHTRLTYYFMGKIKIKEKICNSAFSINNYKNKFRIFIEIRGRKP